jgi:hypothetical protein
VFPFQRQQESPPNDQRGQYVRKDKAAGLSLAGLDESSYSPADGLGLDGQALFLGFMRVGKNGAIERGLRCN